MSFHLAQATASASARRLSQALANLKSTDAMLRSSLVGFGTHFCMRFCMHDFMRSMEAHS
jgi:hypothetical protein